MFSRGIERGARRKRVGPGVRSLAVRLNEAYDPSRLDQQLGEQARSVHQRATWLQFDARSDVLRLTTLYDRYGDDFVQVAGSTAEFAARYSPELKQALASGATPRIEWLPYDWKLNSLDNKQSR